MGKKTCTSARGTHKLLLVFPLLELHLTIPEREQGEILALTHAGARVNLQATELVNYHK